MAAHRNGARNDGRVSSLVRSNSHLEWGAAPSVKTTAANVRLKPKSVGLGLMPLEIKARIRSEKPTPARNLQFKPDVAVADQNPASHCEPISAVVKSRRNKGWVAHVPRKKPSRTLRLKGIKPRDVRLWGKVDPKDKRYSIIDKRTLIYLSDNVPRKKVFDPAGECIYCGSKDNLTMEHIIPYSLGGRFELPSATCDKCQKITSKLEGKISRDQLHVPRSVSGIQTRRKKDRATSVPVTLHYRKTNRKKKHWVDVDVAPLVYCIPLFEQLDDARFGEHYLSKSILHFTQNRDFRDLYDMLFEETKADDIILRSPRMFVSPFVLVLWKIAVGFFWLTARKSLLASRRNRSVIGSGPPVSHVDDRIVGENGEPLQLYTDIRSFATVPHPSRFGVARVFSEMRGFQEWLVCEINILGVLNFPNYQLSIPCIEDKFEEANFTLDV